MSDHQPETDVFRMTAERIVERRLRRVHFNGEGCGTHGPNACSVCHGPSPMSAAEVAHEAVKALADATMLPLSRPATSADTEAPS